MSELDTSDAPSPRRLWLMAIPLVAFAALAVLFWFGLRAGDPSKIPSALIGRPTPQTALPALDGLVVNGRAAIEWGVYGVPETFVVGRDGTIVYKLVGPVTPENIDTVLKPEIDKALGAGSWFSRHCEERSDEVSPC